MKAPPHCAVDPRATAARPHRVPGAAVARRRVRARTGARAARRAGANARRHGAGGGDCAARPAAALCRAARPDRAIRAGARRRFGEGRPIALPPSASPEIAQIIDGLSRTTARIWVIDRGGAVLARAGTLKTPPDDAPDNSLGARVSRVDDRPPVFAGAGTAERGLRATTPRRARAGRTRRRRRARRHPHHQPPSDVRREGGHRQRGASDLGRRPGERRRGRRGDRQRGARAAQPRVRAPVQHRAGGAADRLAGADAVRDVAVVADPAAARRRGARDRRAGPRARAAGEFDRAIDEIGDLSRSFGSVLARLSDYAMLPGEDGEPAVARIAHADRRRALVARQP